MSLNRDVNTAPNNDTDINNKNLTIDVEHKIVVVESGGSGSIFSDDDNVPHSSNEITPDNSPQTLLSPTQNKARNLHWFTDLEKILDEFNYHTETAEAGNGVVLGVADDGVEVYNINGRPHIALTLREDLVRASSNTPQISISEEKVKNGSLAWDFKQIRLANNIRTLKKNTDTNKLASALNQLQCELTAENRSKSNLIVLNHFLRISDECVAGKPFTVEDIDVETNKLEKQLNGLRPLSARIVTAIAGVVGALVGFALGVTLGVIATQGTAALPAGILASLKGFTIGTKVGLLLAGSMGLLSANIGYFSARRKQLAYTITEEPTIGTYKAINEINDKLVTEPSNNIVTSLRK